MEARVNDTKRAAVAAVKSSLEHARDIIFTDYRGLSVAQITELREKLRGQQATYKVVKNAYTRIALEQLGKPDPGDILVGPTAVALVHSDGGPAAKVILDFARETTVRLKGGIVGGKLLMLDQLEALSRLPGRDQLIAMLMSTMKAPIQNMVYVMNGVTQKLARVLQAVADKKAAESN